MFTQHFYFFQLNWAIYFEIRLLVAVFSILGEGHDSLNETKDLTKYRPDFYSNSTHLVVELSTEYPRGMYGVSF